MALQAIGTILLIGVMFGSVSVLSRSLLGQFDPISNVAARFWIAGVIILVLYLFKIKGRSWPKSRILIRRSFIYGLIVDSLEATLYIMSLQYLSAGLAATLYTIFPVVTVILAYFFLPNEKVGWKTGLGVMLGLCGVILIMALGQTGLDVSGGNRAIGYIMLLSSGLVYSLGGIYARKNMADFDTFDSTAFRIFGAMTATTVLKFVLDPHGIHDVTGMGLAVMLIATLFYMGGFQLQFFVLKKFGVSNQAMISYVLPISSSVLGMIMLSEVITIEMIIGMVFIIAGLVVVNSRTSSASAT